MCKHLSFVPFYLEMSSSEPASNSCYKKEFHISQSSGLGDGTDFESGVPGEQQSKLSSIDEGASVKPGVPDIASLMDTIACTEEPSGQTSTLFTVPITVIPTTIPLPPYFFNPLTQQTTPTTSEATTVVPALLDFASVFRFNDRVTNLERDLSELKQVDQYAQAISLIPAIIDRYMDNKLGEAIHEAIQEEVKTQLPNILPKAVLDFATLVIERNVTKSLEADVLARSSSQPKSTYEADASLSEYELTKILLDNMEESKSHLRADYKKELYDALVKYYNTDKDLFNTYGEEFDTGNNDEQPKDEAAPKNNWFKKPERPLTLDSDWNKRQHVDFRPPQTWISVIARAEKPRTSFDELTDTPIDFSAFFMNWLNITNLTQEILYNPEGKPYLFDLRKPLPLIQDHRGCQVIPRDYFVNNDLEYLKGGSLSRKYSTSVTKIKAATYEIYGVLLRWESTKDVYSIKEIIAVTRLKIMKKYDYNHLDEIEVHERYDLNVALRMFTRRIVIQRRVEDLQLGVESYQKKIKLTKPDTFRSNLMNRTAYTAYSDPHGVIYKGQNNRNRLMRVDELHKFSDSTLNDVRNAFYDIASGIRMEYLPKRKWGGLDK
ncbi:hypothetical protein Tco_0366174 [Tanacetum coccineum]